MKRLATIVSLLADTLADPTSTAAAKSEARAALLDLKETMPAIQAQAFARRNAELVTRLAKRRAAR